MTPPGVGWSDWTVILLKPDCLARGLRESVLVWVQREVQVVDIRTVWPTEAQIFTHYSDMLPLSTQLGRDVPAELRRIFVGQPTGLALGRGPNAAPRLRERLGPTDPTTAPADTIRGRFGIDSLRTAMAEGRLVDNLIHSSDTVEVVPRDFDIWYGPSAAHLLAPATPYGGAR
nr:nucleoside-diphosphate kinase [Salinispora cortesiana]